MAELIGRTLGVPEHEMAAFVESARTPPNGRNGRHSTNGGSHDGSSRAASGKAPSGSSRRNEGLRQTPEIPLPPTRFVGRKHEVHTVRELILSEGVRLITLLGPPGIGKTRLSIEVARACQANFEHGPFFVALAAISSADLFIPTLAAALGIKGASDPRQSIFNQIRERPTLLVLDNMEHILAAGAEVARLLRECPRLKVLTTSREPLHIYGEREYTVPALTHALMETSLAADEEKVLEGREYSQHGPLESPGPASFYEQYEAVQLFLQRAQDVEPSLKLADENAYHIAHICWELDGLPLAIELAAAQCKVLTPKAILERLSGRLKLLTRGANDLPDRQRTLRGAIDWSYSLLNEGERTLFRRLGVFMGGRLLEAIEAICLLPGEPELDMLEVVGSLVDKSLLKRETDEEGEPRFYMLWTIREYALERLEESGEAKRIREQHAAYYAALADNAAPALTSARREGWLIRLDAELYNLRAAMQWSLAGSEAPQLESETGDKAEIALRIAGALHWYWYLRGRISEGRDWLERAFAATQASELGDVGKAARARALEAAGRLALVQSDHALILQRLEESVALWRDLGNKRGLAYALTHLGGTTVYFDRKYESGGPTLISKAIQLFKEIDDKWGLAYALDYMGDAITLTGGSHEEVAGYKQQSLILYRDLNDRWGIASMLTELGYVAIKQEDYVSARKRLEEGLAMTRAVGDKRYIALAEAVLAEVVWHMGNPIEARKLYIESLALYRELGDRLAEANMLRNLGHVAHRDGDAREAGRFYRQSLRIARDVGNKPNIALLLTGLAGLVGSLDKPREAAQLLGAADALLESTGGRLPPTDRIQRKYTYETLRTILGDARLTREIENGKAISMETSLQLVEADLLALAS